MKFTAALFALMAISSVAAAPAHLKSAKATTVAKTGKASSKSSSAGNAAAAGAAAASSNATATSTTTDSSSNSTSPDSSSNSTSSDGSSNSTSSDGSSNSTSSDGSSNSTAASSTSTAASATRTRLCDQGDQSLAAGLQAMVVVGLGQQASILTLQNSTAAADFSTATDRLNQFISTQGLQLQMCQGIADDGSFAQTQLKLLSTSQTDQEAMAKTLVDAQTSADTLNTLLTSFLTTTDNAQDGAEQALIDCSLPLTAVSG